MLMPSIFGNDFMNDFFGGFPYKSNGTMQTDVSETDKGYKVTMNLPGYQKEDIKGEVKDGYLTVTATTSKNNDEKDKDGKFDAVFMGLTVALSVVIAVVLFMLTPFFISSLFGKVIKSPMALAVIEGLIRIAIFFIYIVAISQMKDIQRVFMYHGAEHKTINCIEHGAELTPENAAKYSRLHKRCGTSFLLIVMVVSIICFMFIRVDNMALKIVLRVILVPVIAGVSYEVIQWAGRSESCLVNIVSKPGLMLQKLTTREPDLEMLEVAIASIEAIYDWRQFQAENAAAGASGQPGTGSKAGVSQP